MSYIYHSLSHSKWDCKYHIIFTPKMRKSRSYGDIRPCLGRIFHALAAQKDCKVPEGHLKPDHVHMLVEIPPKYKVSEVVGFLKGKFRVNSSLKCHVTKTSRSRIGVTFERYGLFRDLRDELLVPWCTVKRGYLFSYLLVVRKGGGL
jgi:REP element-mobilizing transposase RayT